MPGTPPLELPATASSVAPKLARAAAALAVLLLGLGLVVAPGAVLGNLLSVSAESIAGEGWQLKPSYAIADAALSQHVHG